MNERTGEQQGAVRRGNRIGFAFFRLSLGLFGLKGAYGLLYIVCLYYLLFDRRAFDATMCYVERRFSSDSYLKRIMQVYRIFISQGKNLIDRYCMISGIIKFKYEVNGYGELLALLKSFPRGIILLTAHIGNWQAAMTSLDKFGRIVYMLMRPEENAAVKEMLDIDGSKDIGKVIFADSGLGGVIEIVNALNEGHIVSIMGDRAYGRNSVEIPFLGGIAHFPHGAYNIAAATGCPIVVFLSAKTGDTEYYVDVSHIIQPGVRERGRKSEDILRMATEFSRILEDFVNIYPLQWFVFNDIWAGGPKVKNGPGESVDA
jgi:predicted LPLAT superfamily acyltransferase